MEEMKANRECVAKLDGILLGYQDEIQAIKDSIASKEELRRYFGMDSDDRTTLEGAQQEIWIRVGLLQNAAVAAANAGDAKEKFEYDVEISVLKELRLELIDRLAGMDGDGDAR